MAGGVAPDVQHARGGGGGGDDRHWYEPSGFKVKLLLLGFLAGVLWLYDTGRVEMFVVLALATVLLCIIHPWKSRGGRPLQPEVVACMIGVACLFTFLFTFSLLVGVPGLSGWVDENGRNLVRLPTPKREIPQPWVNDPATATPTTAATLPPIPGQ